MKNFILILTAFCTLPHTSVSSANNFSTKNYPSIKPVAKNQTFADSLFYFAWRENVSIENGTLDDFNGILEEREVDPRESNFVQTKPYLIICSYQGNNFDASNAVIIWKRLDCFYEKCYVPVTYPGVDEPNGIRFLPIKKRESENGFLFAMATIANETGTYFCGYKGQGGKMEYSLEKDFVVADSPNGESIYAKIVYPTPDQIIIGDEIKLRCIINNYRFDLNKALAWHTMTKDLAYSVTYFDEKRFNVAMIDTPNSLIYDLVILNATLNNSDTYRCRATPPPMPARNRNLFLMINPSAVYSNLVTVVVQTPKKPYFGNDTKPVDPDVIRGNTVELDCEARGAPIPTVVWAKVGDQAKCGKPICGNNSKVDNDNQVLRIQDAELSDSGIYYCKATNRLGTSQREFGINVEERKDDYYTVVVTVSILAAILVIAFAIVTGKWCIILRERAKIKELERQLHENSKKLEPELNAQKPLNDQTDQMRFDFNFEIPEEKLVDANRLLGKGAFGKVYLFLWKMDENKTIFVAKKTTADRVSSQQLKCLIGEIKLMMYLGRHPNVLNLLGVVSKNMSRGRLCAILEYCQFGSLKEFIVKRRNNFCPARSPVTNENYISVDEASNQSNQESDSDDAIASNTDSSSQEETTSSNSAIPYTSTSIDSLQPDVTISYHVDRLMNDEEEPLTTMDLLSFAYQIACGIEFLSSKNVVHRDLALRNMLLNEKGIVKVADFGLARRDQTAIDNNQQWPVRWMALESLVNLEFGKESDVWSYGVVLWELFSLGSEPLFDFNTLNALIDYLKRNDRMEAPEHCPGKVYSLMLKCWRENKFDRPSFFECKAKVSRAAKTISPAEWKEIMHLLSSVKTTLENSPKYYNIKPEGA